LEEEEIEAEWHRGFKGRDALRLPKGPGLCSRPLKAELVLAPSSVGFPYFDEAELLKYVL
jgi:hypothetical protein